MENRPFTLVSTSILGCGLSVLPIQAQEIKAPNNVLMAQGESTVSPLVPASFSGTFQTGTGTGYSNSFGSIYGFLPFAQTPNVSTFFGEGRFNAFTDDGGLGGNLRTGYRHLLSGSNTVLGGYVGWDLRDTEYDETFHQLGLGAEVLGETWEARLNGYLPVGNTKRTIASSDTDTGFIGGEVTTEDLRFQGNNLLYSLATTSIFRQQTNTTFSETAMSGFDVEGGYRLGNWDQGKLFAYGGFYFLDAKGGDSTFGVRGRLQAEINSVLAGLSLSSDDTFGTNLQFSFGLKLGGQRQRNDQSSVLARLGQGVQRQEIIAMDRELETTITTTNIPATKQENIAAINPATGGVWNFLHVTDGAAAGNGTFESPLANVTDAVALLPASVGNDIVYVNAGDRSGMAGFVIPDNVQVLSSGVPQAIDIAGFGVTQLQGSGTGTLPLIQSVVTMGNNTRLSGFEVSPPQKTTMEPSGAVIARNVSDFTIDRNTISTTDNFQRGVEVLALEGKTVKNASISGNTIITSGSNAYNIFVAANGDSRVDNATISGNTIASTGLKAYSVLVSADSNSTVNGTVISGNTIETSTSNDKPSIIGNTGIFITVLNNSNVRDTTISGNTVKTQGNNSYGMKVFASGGTVSDVTISENTIMTSGNGVGSSGISVVSRFNTGLVDNSVISGNTITTTGSEAHGIVTVARENGKLTDMTISGNTVTTSGTYAYGIYHNVPSGMMNNITISGNTVTTTANIGKGIQINAFNQSKVDDVMISENTITTSGTSARGIDIRLSSSTMMSNATISGNTINTAGNNAYGISIYGNNSNLVNSTISGNAIKTTGLNGDGIFITSFNSSVVSETEILDNIITTAGNNADGIVVFPTTNGIISQMTVADNTLTTPASNANGILISAFSGAVNGIIITGNDVLQAGFNSFRLRSRSTSNVCVAQFTGNTSGTPMSNDLQIEVDGTSTLNFVEFSDITTNNTGFETISNIGAGTPIDVAACP